ncbi:MAG: FAD-linked oxidase C-terminal domain-containing protein [Pyrinomonadaceae bacterium]
MDAAAIAAVEAQFAFGIARGAGGLMLVAVDGSTQEVERASLIVENVLREGGGFDVIRSETRADEDRLWDVRRALSPAIKRFGTLKFNEDVVALRSRVPELIERVEKIGRRFETFFVNFGHAGDGNIHVLTLCVTAKTQRPSPEPAPPSAKRLLRP